MTYKQELIHLIEKHLSLRIFMINTVHAKRHYIVRTVGGPTFWCLARTANGRYHTFGYFFGLDPEIEGESINVEQLELARKLDATLLFSYPTPDGWEHYQITAKRFAELAYDNNWLRTQYGGERTASIPFEELILLPPE